MESVSVFQIWATALGVTFAFLKHRPCFANQAFHVIPDRNCSQGHRNMSQNTPRRGLSGRNLLLVSQYPLFPLQIPPTDLQISQACDKCTCLDTPWDPRSCSYSCSVDLFQLNRHQWINNFVFPAPPAHTGGGWQSWEGSSGPAATHSHIIQASSWILRRGIAGTASARLWTSGYSCQARRGLC